MGAHSGTSSDDLMFMMGIGKQNKISFISYNKERHGIKNAILFPELKSEYCISYQQRFSKYHTLSLTLEYEKINNYAFISNNISESKIIWFGYSFSLR